jgi:hypothetical protein
LRESRSGKMRARRSDEGEPDTTMPVLGVNVKSSELSQAGRAGIGRRHGGGKAEDLAGVDGDKGVRPLWIGVREVVFGSAIFGTKAVEVVSSSCFSRSARFLALMSARFWRLTSSCFSAPSNSMKAFSPPSPLLEAGADDAQIAALAVAVARRHGLKEPLDGLVGHEKAERLTARVQIALLAQGDHLFNVRTDSLGLGHGGLHAVFDDDGRVRLRNRARRWLVLRPSLNPALRWRMVKLSFSSIF